MSGRPELPAKYLQGARACANALEWWLKRFPDKKPRFVLGPRDVMILAPLDLVVGKFAKNDDALQAAAILDFAARKITGDGCTVFLLGTVLEVLKIPFERVPIEALELGREFVFIDPSKAGQT